MPEGVEAIDPDNASGAVAALQGVINMLDPMRKDGIEPR
jgi:hypothetical protein